MKANKLFLGTVKTAAVLTWGNYCGVIAFRYSRSPQIVLNVSNNWTQNT